MRPIFAILGFIMLLYGCCNLTAGPAPNKTTSNQTGEFDLNKCTAGCSNVPAYKGSCKAQCFTAAAITTKDADICGNINYLTDFSAGNATTLFNSCIEQTAIAKPDSSFCKMIAGGKDRDQCYMSVVYKTKNPSDCAGIADPSTKSSCTSFANG